MEFRSRSRSVARGVRVIGVAAATLTLAACGGETGQKVQDGAEKQATKEFKRIVDGASKSGRKSALKEIDRLERAAKRSKPSERAADAARKELERRAP